MKPSQVFIADQLQKWWSRGKFACKLPIEIHEKSGRVCMTIQTSKNTYHISAAPDYLGCIASSRDPKQGGNDCEDGDFCEATWNQILADIASYEVATDK
jgi:hypothetical protein